MQGLTSINIFISYAREDIKYVDEIKKCINIQALQNITVWDDGRISAGDTWNDTIKSHLDQANIVLLLLSRDFFNSVYIFNVELEMAFKKHSEKKCTIIPIFIRDCVIHDERISALQGLPKEMKFIANSLDIDRDRYYTEVEQGITGKINEIRTNTKINQVIQDRNDADNGKAIAIKKEEHLEKRVLISRTSSELSDIMNTFLLNEAESEIEYKKWDFSFTQLTTENVELNNEVASSTFIVHFIADEAEIDDDTLNKRVDLFASGNRYTKYKRLIIWLRKASFLDKLPLALRENKIVIGLNKGAIIETIKALEKERQKIIADEKMRFSPQTNVFLLYNWEKDHTHEKRRALKKKLEGIKGIIPEYPSSNPATDGIELQLKNNQGVILFYGDTDAKWYCYWQAEIQKMQALKCKAVCATELGKQTKLDSDVNRRAFIVIDDDDDNMDAGLAGFIRTLNNPAV